MLAVDYVSGLTMDAPGTQKYGQKSDEANDEVHRKISKCVTLVQTWNPTN
jgi:hypothetical protein